MRHPSAHPREADPLVPYRGYTPPAGITYCDGVITIYGSLAQLKFTIPPVFKPFVVLAVIGVILVWAPNLSDKSPPTN